MNPYRIAQPKNETGNCDVYARKSDVWLGDVWSDGCGGWWYFALCEGRSRDFYSTRNGAADALWVVATDIDGTPIIT